MVLIRCAWSLINQPVTRRGLHRALQSPGNLRALAHSSSELHTDAQRLLSAVKEADSLNGDLLREVVHKASALPRGSDLATRLLESVAGSFDSLAPSLLHQGDCVSLALHLPRRGKPTDESLKSLILLLGRRLRRQGGHGLPAGELPQLPVLLQRVGFQDQEFFDDFCSRSAECWQELSSSELVKLLRNTEDYNLLHATKGPALARLSSALAASSGLSDLGSPSSKMVSNVAALSRAVLSARSHSLCAPLLDKLQEVLPACAQNRDVELQVALQFALAAAEFHKTIGIPIQVLDDSIKRCQQKLVDGSQEDVLAGELFRVCSLCHWYLAETCDTLFDAFLPMIAKPPSEECLRAGRLLPLHLRRKLVEQFLPKAELEVAEFFKHQSHGSIEAWLAILHDQSLSLMVHSLRPVAEASGIDTRTAFTTLFSASEAAVTSLIDSPSGLAANAAVVSYLAVNTAVHVLESQALETESVRLERLRGLLDKTAKRLEEIIPKLSCRQIQALFRCPNIAESLAKNALRSSENIDDIHTQLTLLLHASAATSDADAVAAGYASLQRRLVEVKETKQLCVVESLLRRHPENNLHTSHRHETLALIQKRIYETTVDASVTWCRAAPRGYVRYVERSVARGRSGKRSTLTVEEEMDEEEILPESVSKASDAVAAISAKVYQPDPESGVKEVVWHRGLESWEVRVEAHGYNMLGGYFKPQDGSEEARDIALAAALEKRRAILASPPSRRHTPY